MGCSSVPTFPLPPHDAGVHCSDTEACPSGQMCLQGRCYAGCDMTHPCSSREMCSAGVCVARTTDGGTAPHDVGIDGGPCVMLACMTPTPVCRADVTRCVQCDATNRDECSGAMPVCNVGRGSCAAFAPAICAACNVTADCPSGLSCVRRTGTDANERVCLPGCLAAACSDQGFTCSSGICSPFASSCTAYRAAVARMPCTADSDCPQLGATIDNGLVTHMCFDDGTGTTPGTTCHAACGLSTDCPAGLTCVGNFCR